MTQRALWTFLLLVAVVWSGWLILITRTETPLVHVTPIEPDGYMTHVTAVQMNKEGAPQSTLYSPNMVHYPTNNATDITTPHIVILSEKGSPWDIRSTYGKTNFGITQVLFWDNVAITRAASAENAPVSLVTNELTVYPNLQFATTDQPVAIKQQDSVVHAKGLRANLKSGIIKLVDQSKGIYDTATPPSPPHAPTVASHQESH